MSQKILNTLRYPLLHINKTFYNLSLRISFKALKTIKVQEIPLYMKRDDDFKISKKHSIQKLEKLLDLRSYVALELVSKCKKFSKVSGYTIGENYQLCLTNGIKKDTLIRFPEILAESDIASKINTLKKLSLDVNESAPLLCLTSRRLKTIANENTTERIKDISRLLEVGECEACGIIVRRQFLLTLDIVQMENNVKLLNECGATCEQIINDLWVLKYSTSTIKDRISMVKEDNIETFKTWMVRAMPEIFERYVQRRSDNRLILGDNSLAEYLSERLECSENVAQYLISKLPALENKSLKKMNEMIDFLFMQGFKPIHICRVPKILLHSVETARNRVKELEAQGMQLENLYILTKSQRQYRQYLESLAKNNNKLN